MNNYQSGPASLFATAARNIASVELSSQIECYIGSVLINKGDILTVRNLGHGLWALSFPRMALREFARVSTYYVNELAGFELVKAS